mmetsp:Transcript_34452/g.57934  ORF Transcript_34452/g.57934 Transcript_34452/m.57934 type:complete len:236 (+) Transcript_34452:83-790(+)
MRPSLGLHLVLSGLPLYDSASFDCIKMFVHIGELGLNLTWGGFWGVKSREQPGRRDFNEPARRAQQFSSPRLEGQAQRGPLVADFTVEDVFAVNDALHVGALPAHWPLGKVPCEPADEPRRPRAQEPQVHETAEARHAEHPPKVPHQHVGVCAHHGVVPDAIHEWSQVRHVHRQFGEVGPQVSQVLLRGQHIQARSEEFDVRQQLREVLRMLPAAFVGVQQEFVQVPHQSTAVRG